MKTCTVLQVRSDWYACVSWQTPITAMAGYIQWRHWLTPLFQPSIFPNSLLSLSTSIQLVHYLLESFSPWRLQLPDHNLAALLIRKSTFRPDIVISPLLLKDPSTIKTINNKDTTEVNTRLLLSNRWQPGVSTPNFNKWLYYCRYVLFSICSNDFLPSDTRHDHHTSLVKFSIPSSV